MKLICENINCYNTNVRKICGDYFCNYHGKLHKKDYKLIKNSRKNKNLEMELNFRLLDAKMRKNPDHGHLFMVCNLIKRFLSKIHLNINFFKTSKSENLLNNIKEKIKIIPLDYDRYIDIQELLSIIHIFDELNKFIYNSNNV